MRITNWYRDILTILSLLQFLLLHRIVYICPFDEYYAYKEISDLV